MQTQDKIQSPQLDLELDQENYEHAIAASSGGCLVADDIKRKYKHFSNVKVDVATVAVTDREKGFRYTYLTPPSARDTLLYFDQGIREEKLPKKITIRSAVKIVPIVRSASNLKLKAERSAANLSKLEAKEQSGEELTQPEKRALTQLRNRKEAPARPTKYGRRQTQDTESGIVVVGGSPDARARAREKHPNLLAGRDRHFGAKMAKPSDVYKKQLEAELEKARAEIKAEFDAELARLKKRQSDSK